MKTKDKKEYKVKSAKDLKKKIYDLQQEKMNKSLELKMGKIKNVHVTKILKKDIATLKTYMKMKQNIESKEEVNEK